MNIVLLFSGIAALTLGLLLETLIRASKSKTWWRARVFIVLGILLVVMGVFQFGGGVKFYAALLL
jgi:hypothetical protein